MTLNSNIRVVLMFSIVGAASTAIDFALYFFLLNFETSTEVAKGASYIAGIINSYFGNSIITFRDKKNLGSGSKILSFLLVYTIALFANIFTNEVMINFIDSWSVLPALLVSIIITFVGLKLVVFKRVNQ